MLDDLAHHPSDLASMLRDALIIGGETNPAELDSEVRSVDARLAAIVASVPPETSARGRALLEALFDAHGGRPLLQSYDAGATTLHDVVTTGRFNCVSATTLYLIAARRAGIDGRPVLLPSHARAVVLVNGRKVVVETTTPNGFDAPPDVSRAAMERAKPRGPRPRVDLYANEEGTEVDWRALLAVTYGNLGIMAEDHGETALAASLLAREAVLTPPAQVTVVRMQQVSLLTELATRALGARRFDEALALARRADAASPDGASKRRTEQNIAAIASQKLLAEEPQMNDAALEAFADPLRAYAGAYGDVRALVLTLDARRKLQHGDVDGSSARLREAAGAATSSDVRGQTSHNARLGEVNRIARLSATDPEAAWIEWQRRGPPDETLAEVESAAARVIEENRAIQFSNRGACSELDSVIGSAVGIRQADTLRSSCHARHALALSDRGDATGALDEMRLAVRIQPGDATHKKNLAALIEKEIDRLVRGARCDVAAPLMVEGRSLDPATTFFDEAAAFCRAR